MKLYLHPAAEAQVHAVVRQPPGTVMFHGAQGVGKRTVALEVARQLNCEGCHDASCRSCRLATSHNHPNIIVVQPDDKQKIGVEAVHDLQHGLQYQQYERAGRRVVIIRGAETLTLPAQNALLKTLEEPPVGTLMILTSPTPQALLPTVLSRCRLVYLPRLPDATIEAFVRQTYPHVEAAAIVAESQGLVGRAVAYVTDPARLEQAQQVSAQVQCLLQEPELLPRLQLAAHIAAAPEQRTAVMTELLRHAQRSVRQQAVDGRVIVALERLQQRLRANVNPKTAFEALVVELV